MDVERFIADMLDVQTPRDLQLEVGPSELMGCERRLWHRVHGTETCNFGVLRLPSWMGRVLHDALGKEAERQDPWGERYLIEYACELDGVPAHIDLLDLEDGEIVDWKTSTKAKLIPSKWPGISGRAQVHDYARMARARGHDIRTVVLVGIPRDGDETGIKVHREPYDEATAMHGRNRLERVKVSPTPPPPTENWKFCRDYCDFYDPTEVIGCPGRRS